MTTHTLHLTSRGPWATPPDGVVLAYCTCNAWRLSWTRDELAESAAAAGTTIHATEWATVAEAVRAHHLEHIAQIVQRAARHASLAPDPDFYA